MRSSPGSGPTQAAVFADSVAMCDSPFVARTLTVPARPEFPPEAKKTKMPTDVNQRAKVIVDFATGTEDIPDRT